MVFGFRICLWTQSQFALSHISASPSQTKQSPPGAVLAFRPLLSAANTYTHTHTHTHTHSLSLSLSLSYTHTHTHTHAHTHNQQLTGAALALSPLLKNLIVPGNGFFGAARTTDDLTLSRRRIERKPLAMPTVKCELVGCVEVHKKRN